MAYSINKVILIGNLGQDAETRNTQSGKKIVNLRIATSDSYKKDGQTIDRTEWHTVCIFNEFIANFACDLRKGSKVYVEGALQTRKWEDKEGNERYSTEVVIGAYNGQLVTLDGKQESSSKPSKSSKQAQHHDDDIPF